MFYIGEIDDFENHQVECVMMLGQETLKNLASVSFSGKKLAHYPRLLQALLDVKEAALITNQACGHIDQVEALPLSIAIKTLRTELIEMSLPKREECFPVDVLGGGGSIGIHLNLAEYLAIKAQVPLACINRSQSTADVCHTASRLAIMRTWPDLKEALQRLITTLQERAFEFLPVATLARTCLQDGSVISMGASLSAHPAALTRRLQALEHSIGRLSEINLGGTAVGTKEQASGCYLANIVGNLSVLTGINFKHRKNLYDAAQNSDDLGSVAQELGQIALVLMKTARDLRLLSSGPRGGFGELRLPKVQEGSSFYANKINPIIPETMLHCGFLVLGACHTAQCALQHAELQLNVFESAVTVSILDGMTWLTNSVEAFQRFGLAHLEVVSDRCQELSRFYAQPKS